MSEVPDPKKTRRMLLLLGTISVAPFVASLLLYLFWTPRSFTNYGELLPVAPLAGTAISTRDGTPFRIDELRGKWAFVMVDQGGCDPYCRSKLYLMRQVRLTQGKDRGRLERLWLITDDVEPEHALKAEYQGTRLIRVGPAEAFVSRLPAAASPRDHIYLIDPLGNLMMRFPRDADPQRVKKDVSKLLKVSGGWRQTGPQD
jgi:hypothetical protein